MENTLSHLQDLITVAGHAPFKETIQTVPQNPESDAAWVLQAFQRGEPPLYIEHIRRGLELLKSNPAALLLFSGGHTRKEAGLRWSEAETYRAIAKHFRWWMPPAARSLEKIETSVAAEDFSRDSFENLLFSICRFQELTGDYPRHVTLISWEFKRKRFEFHRAAIRFPSARFSFAGFNQPADLKSAERCEAATLLDFQESRYGNSGKLAEKRAGRNPFGRRHGFRACPGLGSFFDFIENPDNQQADFPQRLPWED